MADAKWYVVQTYSGYENTVKATIEKTVENRQLQNAILTIAIPTETVTEKVERRKKNARGETEITHEMRTYERKLFPGYVLVKMVYSNEVWHMIKSIRGVTGFLGDSANKESGKDDSKEPIPLSEDEVIAMGMEKKEVILGYQVGDTVRIYESAFRGQTGIVEDIDLDNGLVYLSVKIANRQTPIPPLPLDAVELESH